MKFGHLDSVEGLSFQLPEDPAFTLDSLSGKPVTPNIFIGCPVWSEKSYVGHIYPIGTKPADYLKAYARQFNSIEVNATRYGIPNPSTLDKWRLSVPADFKFSFKVPQIVSHSKDITSDSARVRMDKYYESIYNFGNNMGTGFIILPKYFGADRLPVLEKFVRDIPKEVPLAIEFRNADILRDRDMWNLLRSGNLPLIITDSPGERDFVHQIVTSDTVFIRFVGALLHPTDYTRIDAWVDKLLDWSSRGVKNIYFYMHQPAPYKHLSADLAAYMIDRLNTKKPALQLKAPVRYSLDL